MIWIVKEAVTVDDAISLGLEQLAVERDDVDIIILRKGEGGEKAKVKLVVKSTPQDEIAEYIEGLLDRMGVDCSVRVTPIEGGYAADISGKDSAVVIGYRGEVLDALQYIATINLNKQEKNYTRLVLDVEGYRSRRAETLKELALRLADRADRTGEEQQLEPMNTADRKIIHEALADDERVTTASSGEDPFRYVVISPKEKPITYGTSKSFKTSGTKTRSFGAKKKRF